MRAPARHGVCLGNDSCSLATSSHRHRADQTLPCDGPMGALGRLCAGFGDPPEGFARLLRRAMLSQIPERNHTDQVLGTI